MTNSTVSSRKSGRTVTDSKTGQKRSDSELRPLDDLRQSLKNSVRQQPEVAALVCLGLGFILGWKLKPW